jgi:hypothetical protein
MDSKKIISNDTILHEIAQIRPMAIVESAISVLDA